MLYTIMPQELIMGNNGENEKLDVAMYKGVLVEGIRMGDRLKITRLISSDPNNYLNDEFSPGKYIKLDVK